MDSDSVETCHPCTSHYPAHVKVTSKETPKDLWLCQKTIDFHWIQSKYCLSEMLSKHWDHIKILHMITKLLITCVMWSHQFDPMVSIYGNTHIIQINGLSTPHSTFHHLHTHTHTLSTLSTHTHKITYLYILLYMSAQEHVMSTTRGE